MKILYISQYYPPEIGAPSARVSELSRQWAKDGDQVTVLTAFPHHPHGTKRKEDIGVLYRTETEPKYPNLKIVRSYVLAFPNSGFLKRIVSYLSFMISSIVVGLFLVKRHDVVIATSPQFFCGISGRIVSWFKRSKYIFEVRDLWPESIVTVGAMKQGIAYRILRWTANFLYRSCDRIVTVGEGYRDRIVENYSIDTQKCSVIPNGVDFQTFDNETVDRNEVRSQYNWQPNESIVLYLGTHGMAHGLDTILDVAQSMQEDRQYKFVFVGDGAEKQKLIERSRSLNLSNVEFLDPVDKQGVVQLYFASDIGLVPLRNQEVFRDVYPSKMFEFMACGIPFVLSVDGYARTLVEESHAGIFAEPENAQSIAEAIRLIGSDDTLREKMSEAGKQFSRRYFDRSKLAAEYLGVLHQTVGMFNQDTETSTPLKSDVNESVRPDRISNTGQKVH